MITKNYSTEEPRVNPHKVDVRQLFNHESAQVIHITLKPGESLKPHRTPVDVAFYILEGNPIVHIGNETLECDRDTLVESPADIVHYLSNTSEINARFLVIKAPRPEKGTRLL